MSTAPEKEPAFGGDLTPLSQLFPTDYVAPVHTSRYTYPEDADVTDIGRSTSANGQAEFHRVALGDPEKLGPDPAALAWVAPIKEALSAAQPDLTPDGMAYEGEVGELLNESRVAAAEYAGTALSNLDNHNKIPVTVRELQEGSSVQQESPPQS